MYWRRENEYTAEQKVCCPELCISGRHAGGHDPGLHRGLDLPQELDAEGNVISAGATVLEPLGTLFLNMMFCIVVPMVFSSIAGSVATMKSRKRAGKIMGTTVLTFVITGAIAAVIMIVIMKIFPRFWSPGPT